MSKIFPRIHGKNFEEFLEFNGKLTFLIPEWCSSLATAFRRPESSTDFSFQKSSENPREKLLEKRTINLKELPENLWKISRENHQEKLEENTASNKDLIKNWKSENGEEKYWKNKFDFSDSSGYSRAFQPSPFRAPRRVASFPPILASTRPQIPRKFSLFSPLKFHRKKHVEN